MDSGIVIDVTGVQQLGVENWQRRFQWPVHPELYSSRVCRQLLRRYLGVAMRAQEDHQLVLISTLKVHLMVYNWVHMLLLDHGASSLQSSIRLFEETLFTDLLDGSKSGHDLVQHKSLPESPTRRKVGRAFLRFAKTQIANRQAYDLYNQLRSGDALLAFPYQMPIAQRYCDIRGGNPIFVPMELLAGPRLKADGVSDWDGLIEEIWVGYCEVICHHCGVLAGWQRDVIWSFLKIGIGWYFEIFNSTVKWLSRFPKVHSCTLLSSSLGSPIHKIVCQAVRHLGGKVVGMSHSNAFGRPNNFSVIPNEVCDYVRRLRAHDLIHLQG